MSAPEETPNDGLELQVQHQLIQSLLFPQHYPHVVSQLQLIETHISFVLLTGQFAYKIKKAVNLGFVDYSELEMRRHFCNEELRLNRRLAPELYLEAVAIGGTPQNPQFNPAGPAFEYAVMMRQFGQNELLDRILPSGLFDATQVDALAIRLAHFHQAASQADPASGLGDPDAIWRPVEDNFVFFANTPWASDPRIEPLHSWCALENRRLTKLFKRRREAGLIRECHGDLHLGNIVLHDNEATPFDCIEFSQQLRWIDIFNDLAFLFMDLNVHGRSDYAWRLLNTWLDVTGDHEGLSTLRFYAAYRALVRAKVAALRCMDKALPTAERASIESHRLACLDYACRIPAQKLSALIVMHGFSGSGKTHYAQTLATQMGAICLRSDVERKRLHGLEPQARARAGIEEGIYSIDSTRATYDNLKTRAGQALSAGYSVIIDAANLQCWQRQLWLETAQEHAVPYLLLDCQADDSVLLQRLIQRQKAGNDASDADIVVLRRQQARCEPLSSDEQAAALSVNDATADNLTQRTCRRLGWPPQG